MAQQSLYPIRWMSGGLPPTAADFPTIQDGLQSTWAF
jgi:hypothetical protein